MPEGRKMRLPLTRWTSFQGYPKGRICFPSFNWKIVRRWLGGSPTLANLENDHGFISILNKDGLPETSSTRKLILINGNIGPKRTALDVLSPDIYTPIVDVELLDHWNDEYEGVIINSESLPSSANAFASALQASLFQ